MLIVNVSLISKKQFCFCILHKELKKTSGLAGNFPGNDVESQHISHNNLLKYCTVIKVKEKERVRLCRQFYEQPSLRIVTRVAADTG